MQEDWEYNERYYDELLNEYEWKKASITITGTILEPVRSGRLGYDAFWAFSDDGTLTVSGTGETPKLDEYSPGSGAECYRCPWANYISDITSIVIGDGITSINDCLFDHCSNVTHVTIAPTVTSIGAKAFQECSSLTRIDIPDSVTTIGGGAFADCSLLASIQVSEANDCYTVQGGILFNKAMTELHTYPAGLAGKYAIPYSVTSIAEAAFAGRGELTGIVFPAGLTTIGNDAFRDCAQLTDFKLPEGLTAIGDRAFSACEYLETVIIPGSVTSVGDQAFSQCSRLETVIFRVSDPEVVLSYGSEVFEGEAPAIYCYRVSPVAQWAGNQSNRGIRYIDHVLRLPESLQIIEDMAFADLENVDVVIIPSTVRRISTYAFVGSDITIVAEEGSRAETWAKRYGIPVLNQFE